ncbi:MAG: ATP-binding cassette domain-containing protein [Thermoproteota archaeon]
MSGNCIIKVEGLTKVFDGRIRAVDGISFKVRRGEIMGFLGPNGAGKTTTLNMLSTLLRPTSGTASVNGYDINEERNGVRRSIGFVFQDQTLDNELTGRENLDFHCRIYGLKRDTRHRRIKEMLELVRLTDRADDLAKTYSGGMKRRLEIARGLLHHPKVLFLDEPTLGLDPQTRRKIWGHTQRLNQEEDITIILTTHYTEEADQLCDRILIIDSGKIVALDTPDELKGRLKGDIVSLTFRNSEEIEKVQSIFEEREWIHRVVKIRSKDPGKVDHTIRNASDNGRLGGVIPKMGGSRIDTVTNKNRHGQRISDMHGLEQVSDLQQLNLVVDNGGRRIPEIVKIVDRNGAGLQSVELHKPTLDDVFLSVTGREIREEKGSFMDDVRRYRLLRQARSSGGRR